MIHKFLSSVDLSPEQSRIYACLLENGTLSAGRLAQSVGLSRPSVYDHLKTLEQSGLVKQSTRLGVKGFYAEQPERIGAMLETRLKALQKQKQEFDAALPALSALGRKKARVPHLRTFEGADELRHVLTDILLHADIKTRSYLPIRALVKVLSADFFREHTKERQKHRISVQAVWALDKNFSDRHLPQSSNKTGILRDIRILPEAHDTLNGYWIYGDTCIFLSCGDHPFGFVSESPEYARMMTAQHDMVWMQAVKLPMSPEDVRPFLREIGIDL